MDLIDILTERLHQGIVSFAYVKKDGTIRNALGTLRGVEKTIKGTGHHANCSWTLRYYDVDCKEWRSFLISKLISVGNVRRTTMEEHHDICLALVVKLKNRMKEGEKVAFAYRKNDGTIRYAHGILTADISNCNPEYFCYFDTDKGEKRTFRIDRFISFGEEDEIDINGYFDALDGEKARPCSAPSARAIKNLAEMKVSDVLARHGIAMCDTEDILVIDLLPYLDKEQLRDLIVKATNRLAEL